MNMFSGVGSYKSAMVELVSGSFFISPPSFFEIWSFTL